MQIDETVGHLRSILRDNDQGDYCVPSASLFPYRWLWDCAFHSLGWATFDEARAWTELEAGLSGQWDSGMVPSIDFRDTRGTYFPGPDFWQAPERTSGVTQPALSAWSALRLFHSAEDRSVAEDGLRCVYPKLLAFHRWLYKVRYQDGLLVMTHPWESGFSNSPMWDEALERVPIDNVPEFARTGIDHVDTSQRSTERRYQQCVSLAIQLRELGYDTEDAAKNSFWRIADPSFNAIALASSEALVEIADILDTSAQEAIEWQKQGQCAVEALWNEEQGMFTAYDMVTQQAGNVAGIAGFFPLLTDVPTTYQVERLTSIAIDWADAVEFAFPSYDPDGLSFEPKRHWRGSTWIHTNWLLSQGFIRHAQYLFADQLREDALRLYERSGAAECFDPTTGEACGVGAFSSAAATLLEWLS